MNRHNRHRLERKLTLKGTADAVPFLISTFPLYSGHSVDVRGTLHALVVQTFGASALNVLMLAPCPDLFRTLR